METLAMGITARIYNPNEARGYLDLLPYEGGDEYENPAISPGAATDEDTVDEPMDGQTANRLALVAHLKHMIGVECNHVLTAAGNKRNYIGWIDHFYDIRWKATFCRSLEAFNGTSDLAIAHCEQSKLELIELAGTVTADGLADAVSELTKNWTSRAEQLADNILKEVCHA